MTVNREFFTLTPPDPKELTRNQEDPYCFTRERIARNLFDYTLIDSYKKFEADRIPYPFVSPGLLRPGSVENSKEFTQHNSALIILMNGAIPNKLRKHFRFREGNRLCKENLVEVAPDLPKLDQYKWPMRFSNHKGFGTLMKILTSLDYALLVQSRTQSGETWPFELTHFHVKIERLLDNAIRNLAVYLNYLERGLYERGEAFVDLLEKKFFEYFNFYHNASGRRCAAALAAQLLAREKIEATIFISSQQTRRLTFLTTSSKSYDVAIEQYTLLNVEPNLWESLKSFGGKNSLDIEKDFSMKNNTGTRVMLFRVRYEHTDAGRPSPDGQLKSGINPREKWIRLKDEFLIPVNRGQNLTIACPLVYRRLKDVSPKS